MIEITQRQLDTLMLLRFVWLVHRRAPRIKELADGMGIERNAVRGHLLALRRKGLVTWDDGKNGTLREVS